MAQHGLIEQVPQGEIILGLGGERITSGFDFYAAFQSTEDFIIRCGSEEIGRLPADIVPPVGEHLILAGKRWRVEELLPNQKMALVVLSPGGKARSFQGSGGEIHTRVVREIKTVLLSDDEPPYIDLSSKLLLRAARQAARRVGLAEKDIIVGKQSVQWFPWIGSRGLLTLSLIAKSFGIAAEADQLSITYHIDCLNQFDDHLRKIASADPELLVWRG
jgi:ATP-dependent Lhr-like helicase